jgi:hypothetical protein
MVAFNEMFSQRFLEKADEGSFRVMKELMKLKYGDSAVQLEGAMNEALAGIKATKGRVPHEVLGRLAAGTESEGIGLVLREFAGSERVRAINSLDELAEYIARGAARGYAKIEPAMHSGMELGLLSDVMSGVSKDKTLDALRALGYKKSGAATHANPQLAAEMLEAIGKAVDGAETQHQKILDQVNAALNNAANDKPGPASRQGLLASAANTLKRVWGGKTFLGNFGGKAAIIGGGALLAKSIFDAAAPPDEIAPSNVPLPPDIQGPISAPPQPNWAIMQPPVPIERPDTQTFRARGVMEADEGLGFANAMHGLVQSLSNDHPAYGYIDDNNIPMSDVELEHYLDARSRSSF